jgi:hypothetical protein
VSGEVAELEQALAPEVKMSGPEPVRRWPGCAAPRAGARRRGVGSRRSGSCVRRGWRRGRGRRETEPEEPEEELGVGWWWRKGGEEAGGGRRRSAATKPRLGSRWGEGEGGVSRL